MSGIRTDLGHWTLDFGLVNPAGFSYIYFL
jgi:hypothetical protein